MAVYTGTRTRFQRVAFASDGKGGGCHFCIVEVNEQGFSLAGVSWPQQGVASAVLLYVVSSVSELSLPSGDRIQGSALASQEEDSCC